MTHPPYVKKGIWPYVVAIIVLVFVVAGIGVYRSLDKLSNYIFKQTDIGEQLVQNIIGGASFGNNSDLAELLPLFLGFDEPRTYLVLFQNNTELRPSGGFIGVYAVIRMDGGKMELLKLEGTEILDWQTPDTWKPVPPQPLTDRLGVDRWYFRDSNWSPDFPTAARKALELYTGEDGAYASEIDTVLAITPTVFERLLKLTGPVTVEGKTFTPENGVEMLEYEVEYAYKDFGRTAEERKDIIVPLAGALIQRATIDGLLNPEKYINTLQGLLDEKHILAYSVDGSLHQQFQNVAWTGRMVTTTGDYLMWIDANLGALKTDHAIERSLTYTLDDVDRAAGGWATWRGTATMRYNHTGGFDWRTTRYLTYARVFVPEGAVIESVHRITQDGTRIPITNLDTGVALEKQWFGAFTSIEPGRNEALEFRYILPRTFTEYMRTRAYTLTVQKQAGTASVPLSLDLNMGTGSIVSATPPESEVLWGDTAYQVETNLRTDKVFAIDYVLFGDDRGEAQ